MDGSLFIHGFLGGGWLASGPGVSLYVWLAIHSWVSLNDWLAQVIALFFLGFTGMMARFPVVGFLIFLARPSALYGSLLAHFTWISNV